MIKNVKIFIFLILFVLANCSFDNKTGIWSGDEKEKRRIGELHKEQKDILEVVKIYSSEDTFRKEISASSEINLTQAITNDSWTMSGLNSQNFQGHLYLQGINNTFLKKKIGKNKFSISRIMLSPLIFKDYIYFSDDTGSVFKINKAGKIVWKKNIYRKIYKKIYKKLNFKIYKNKIYVSDNIGFIYSLNIDNGDLYWIKNHGVPLKSNIKVYDQKIYLINQDNRIICLSTKDGSKIWDVRSIESFIKLQNFLSLAITKKGDLVLLSSSGDLIKINSKNGRVYWSLNATGNLYAHDTDFFKSSNIVIDKNAILFSALKSIYSYNLADGTLNWKSDLDATSNLIIDKETIFLVTENGFLVSLDKTSGEIKYSTNVLKILKKKKRSTKISGFILGSNNIYSVTLNGFLIVSSAKTGKNKNFKKIGDNISTSPSISNGELFILTDKSKIFCLN